MYSQKKEDRTIWNYFHDKPPGQLLDIGANDGRLFSNSLWLLEHGWGGVLVEPSPKAFKKLQENHKRGNIYLMQYAITDHDGMIDLYESGSVKVTGRHENVALVSTIIPDYLRPWTMRVGFEKVSVPCLSFKTFLERSPIKQFEFITIDAEGEDWNILQQMDLNALGCQFICIEHDKVTPMIQFKEYIEKQGYRYIAHTQVNLLMAK